MFFLAEIQVKKRRELVVLFTNGFSNLVGLFISLLPFPPRLRLRTPATKYSSFDQGSTALAQFSP